MDPVSFWIGVVVGFSACVIFLFLFLILVVTQVVKSPKTKSLGCPDQDR
jgi:hypothetical protein